MVAMPASRVYGQVPRLQVMFVTRSERLPIFAPQHPKTARAPMGSLGGAGGVRLLTEQNCVAPTRKARVKFSSNRTRYWSQNSLPIPFPALIARWAPIREPPTPLVSGTNTALEVPLVLDTRMVSFGFVVVVMAPTRQTP